MVPGGGGMPPGAMPGGMPGGMPGAVPGAVPGGSDVDELLAMKAQASHYGRGGELHDRVVQGHRDLLPVSSHDPSLSLTLPSHRPSKNVKILKLY